MSDGLLEDIIQLEAQIQAQLATEKERAASWRERELAEIEASLSSRKSGIEDHSMHELEKLRVEVLRQGESFKAEAAAWCQRLTALSDATLSEILYQQLAAILPGGDNDHPHGQD